MPRRLLAACAALLAAGPAPAQQGGAGYRPKPPEIALPEGAEPGSVRREIQPFGPWTLICDENLRRRQRVCNVTQTILDGDGATAFSWSLAGTRGGTPAFILRAPVTGPPPHYATLTFPKAGEQVVELPRCDTRQCLGFLDVTPEMRADIAARTPVAVAYRPREGAEEIRFDAPLTGLASALAAIR